MGKRAEGGPGVGRGTARPPLQRLLAAVARIALLAGLAVGVGFPLLLYLMQDQMIFPGPRVHAPTRDLLATTPDSVEVLEVVTPEGHRLRGWLRRFGTAQGAAPLLLYFGGNAEDVARTVHGAELLAPWAMAAFDYRGFGESEGSPGEAALFADALLVHDALVARPDVDASRVAAMGRSLGSGVAVFLAENRPLTRIVLVTAYDSITAVAEGAYPFVPVRLLLRHPFDSLARAPDLAIPALFVIAGRDTVIPSRHAERLRDAWGGPTRTLDLARTGHNGVSRDGRYWPTVRTFLAEPAPR